MMCKLPRTAWLLAGLLLCACGVEVHAEATTESKTFAYDSGGRRDPFVPLVREGKLISISGEVPVGGSKPTLYGILWDPEGHSLALINDVEAKVGDTVGGYVVKEIRQDAVVLEGGGELEELRIEFEQPKATSGAETEGEQR